MGQPAAKEGDQVLAVDMHQIQPPGTAPPVFVPHPFSGKLDGALSSDVKIEGKKAATKESTATNSPSHVPIGGTFVSPPANKGTVDAGSATVKINGKPAARTGDTVKTCNDPSDLPAGSIVAAGTVLVG